MKYKYLVVLISVIFGITSVLISYRYRIEKIKIVNQQVEAVMKESYTLEKKEQTPMSEEKENISDIDIDERVANLFIDADSTFIKADLTMDELSSMRAEIDQLPLGEERTQLTNKLEEVSTKLFLLQSLNSLFTTAVLTGDQENVNAILKEQTTNEQIQNLLYTVNSNSDGDAFYQKIIAILNKEQEYIEDDNY